MPHKIFRWFASLSVGLGLVHGGMVHSQVSAKGEEQANIDQALPIQVPVLVLTYYPPDPAHPAYLDPIETGWTDFPITDMQNATQGMISAGQMLVSDATRYHGYKDLSAPMYLQYYTFDYKEFFYPIPRGVLLDPPDIYRPHYRQIMRDLDICNYVDVHGVKEVWMYGYHFNQIVPDESRMSSKYGDISNSWPKEEQIPAEYRLPPCTNSYVLYNFTYQPGGAAAIGNTVHNRMHQIEAVIGYADYAGTVFWGDFAEYYPNPGNPHEYKSSCGNGHWATNWSNSTTHGYRYDLLNYRENNCETWHPDDNQTTYVNANCTQWGCTDTGFYKWFMQNMPGYNNGIVHKSQQMRNWWDAMHDFNQFIDVGRSLFVQTSTTMRSAAAKDGWVLESTETSSQGGSTNAGATTFVLGDNAQDRQYRAILNFNTSSLPDDAIITKVVLKIRKQSLVGSDPFTTHMKIAVDIRTGTFSNAVDLQPTDFQAAANKPNVALIANNPQAGDWYFTNFNALVYYINRTGITQFRLRFQKDDDDDLDADYLKFYSGDAVAAAYRPRLIVTYYVP